jgi:hypothetical protein
MLDAATASKASFSSSLLSAAIRLTAALGAERPDHQAGRVSVDFVDAMRN